MTEGGDGARKGHAPRATRDVVVMVGAAAVLMVVGAPGWLALGVGVVLALASGRPAPAAVRTWTGRVLQAGVIGLGAGMDLEVVLRAGASGAVLTATSLALALGVGWLLGRALRVPSDTSLLINVGTAICGGSAIAAVASVTRPRPHELSVSLGVVFLLNALALVIFPPLGHLLGLPGEAFGRWAALAIHDTSSVVGAALVYGDAALVVATSTKLARALWIVPLTLLLAVARQRDHPGGLRAVRWPWFIAGFLATAALFTWIPALEPVRGMAGVVARRLLVLALFLVGLSLTRDALREVGSRPLVHGVLLWIVVGVSWLLLARWGLL